MKKQIKKFEPLKIEEQKKVKGGIIIDEFIQQYIGTADVLQI